MSCPDCAKAREAGWNQAFRDIDAKAMSQYYRDGTDEDGRVAYDHVEGICWLVKQDGYKEVD